MKEWKARQKEELKQIEAIRRDPSRDKREAAWVAEERRKELERHDEQLFKGLRQQQEELKRTLDARLNERINTFKQRATREKAETAKVFLEKYKTLKEEHRTQQLVYNENRRRLLEDIFIEQARNSTAVHHLTIPRKLEMKPPSKSKQPKPVFCWRRSSRMSYDCSRSNLSKGIIVKPSLPPFWTNCKRGTMLQWPSCRHRSSFYKPTPSNTWLASRAMLCPRTLRRLRRQRRRPVKIKRRTAVPVLLRKT